MIRRDYILRMIEEFMQALARLRSLKQDQRWDEATGELDAELKKLIGSDTQAVTRLSETELVARLMQDGPTHALNAKALILTTLLQVAGDVATASGHEAEGQECYLKALHLLLEILARGEVFDCPEFVPRIEMLLAALESTTLPVRTHAMLMQHYERTGEYAKAEDALFAMLDAEPDNHAIVDFGITFYERLLAQNNATLDVANLPRGEAEEGLEEMRRRKSGAD